MVQMTRLWGLCELQLRLSFLCLFLLCARLSPSLFYFARPGHDMVGFWSPHFASVLAPAKKVRRHSTHEPGGGHHSDGGLSPTE